MGKLWVNGVGWWSADISLFMSGPLGLECCPQRVERQCAQGFGYAAFSMFQ